MHICAVNGRVEGADSLLEELESKSEVTLRVASYVGPVLRTASL